MVFDGHQQEIYSLDFSKDGHLIVSGSGDKTARIWSMSEPNHTYKICEYKGCTMSVYRIKRLNYSVHRRAGYC
jgi:WD40 repeat protein